MKIMASGPIISWEIDGETVETVSDFIFLGSKITADGDCSHEIKRRLLLGRKVIDVWAQKLWHMGLVTLQHVEYSQTRDRTHLPCTGKRILNHWTTREVPKETFKMVTIIL